MKDSGKKRRSGIKIMMKLIGLVKPLLHIMMAAILLGVAGYLCAIFLTILAGQVVLGELWLNAADMEIVMKSVLLETFFARRIFVLMGFIAVLRGLLHYAEQYCNHFIAFKLLAIIRHKVFAALRKLCPAKLEGRDKGNLISIITTDIELLEVFYAHTISPIAIATLTSLIMVIFIGNYHMLAGLLALLAYVVVGAVIPVWNGKRGASQGMEFRTEFGHLNSFVLDSLRGLEETIQYGQGEVRKAQMEERSKELGEMQKELSRLEGTQRAFTNLVILLASFGMLFLTLYLYQEGSLGIDGVLTCTIAMMGSFGPVVALSSLSNNLNQTLASGERVLSILEEKPLVEEVEECEQGKGVNEISLPDRTVVENMSDSEEVSGDEKTTDDRNAVSDEKASSDENAVGDEKVSSDGNAVGDEKVSGDGKIVGNEKATDGRNAVGDKMLFDDKKIAGDGEISGNKAESQRFTGADVEHVTFSYEDEVILKDYSLSITPGKIVGIHGVSGSGKSTLLKLLMRFWDADQGKVAVDGTDVRKLPTKRLRDMESYVTQETHLFHDSIANNIVIGKPGATREEIMEAAKKASIHDFIMTLPKGYDTEVGELGDTLSGGERQRIGIARAFLHDAPFLLLDEPTSNLDSLNEGVILKSLQESCDNRTVVLVSHRKSTMNLADVVYEMENGRLS